MSTIKMYEFCFNTSCWVYFQIYVDTALKNNVILLISKKQVMKKLISELLA